MNIRNYCIASLLCVFSCYCSAQDWVSMAKDPGANIHDVQQAFNKWYSQQHKDKDAVRGEEEDGSYEQFSRWEWLMQARANPAGQRPDLKSAAAEYQDFVNAKATQRNRDNLHASSNWSYAGSVAVPVNGEAGRVNRIRFYPGNNNIIYACTPSGGLWKSTNGGTTWSTNTDKLLDLAICDIAIDPKNPNIMYIGTGDNDGLLSGYTPSTIGVLKSTDGGNTWNATTLYYTLQASGGMTVNQLMIDPDSSNVIFAATSFGLYCSHNYGLAWNQVLTGDIKDIEFEPFHTSTMYASNSHAGFFRSSNGGISFTQVYNGLPGLVAGRMAIAVTPADSNYVYVLADQASNYGFYGLYLSTDRGQTFTQQSNSPNLLGWSPNGSDNGGQGWYTLALAVSPVNPDFVLVGGVNVWASWDDGVTWSLNGDWTGTGAPYLHADIHQLCFLPGGSGTNYYATCDGGVFETPDAGGNWYDFSDGLEIAEQYSIGLSSNNSNMWLTGWQDNGTNLAGAPWNEVLGGDGMVCFIDYSNNNNMFGEFYNGSFESSSNGGASWNNATNGITETGPWVTRWLQDPVNPNVLVAGLNNVWESTNQGGTWNQVSNISLGSVTALAVAPSNDNYIYVAGASTMYVTTNNGASWTDITAGLPVAFASISAIAVDPNNAGRVWVTFSGFSPGNKVCYSGNAGATWTNISSGLPNLPANCIVYQQASPDGIYIGTDMGVYYHDSILKTWVDFNNGLPNVIIQDIKMYEPGNILRVATYGRGTWQSPGYVPPTSAPVAYFTAYPAKVCSGTTIVFTDTSTNQPTSWNWTFPGGTPATSTLQNPTVTYNTAGKFLVKLVASNVKGSDSVAYNNYITVFGAPPSLTIVQSTNNDTLTCAPSGLAYYQWYRNSTPIPGANSYKCFPIHQTGVYSVNANDTNGCSSSGRYSAVTVGIDEVQENSSIKVFPNPTHGSFQLQFNAAQEGEYELNIYNVLGQIIYSDELHVAGQFNRNIDLSGYGQGVYMLSVKGKDAQLLKKIVVY